MVSRMLTKLNRFIAVTELQPRIPVRIRFQRMHFRIPSNNTGLPVHLANQGIPLTPHTHIKFTSNEATSTTEGEHKLEDILVKRFPGATNIVVKDISGGCGSMYEIHVESRQDFEGKRIVMQHKLVTDALRSEVGKMHGLRVFTTVPE